MKRRDFLKASASFAVAPAFLPKFGIAQAMPSRSSMQRSGSGGLKSNP